MVLCVRMNASGLFPSIAVGTVPIVLLNLSTSIRIVKKRYCSHPFGMVQRKKEPE